MPKSRRAFIAENTDIEPEIEDRIEPYLFDPPDDDELVCSEKEVREACDGIFAAMQ